MLETKTKKSGECAQDTVLQGYTLCKVHSCHDGKPNNISHGAAQLEARRLLVHIGGIISSIDVKLAQICLVLREREVLSSFDHAIEECLSRFLVHRNPLGAEFLIETQGSLVEPFGGVFQEVKIVLAESS
jgi:hypothetical protein